MRTTTIVGLLATLYLVVDAAYAGASLSSAGWGLAAVAVVLATAPRLLLVSLIQDGVLGARRVVFLGVGLSLCIAASVGPSSVSMTRDVVLSALLPLAAFLTVDLALVVPDRAPEQRLRWLFIAGGVSASVGGMAASLPAFHVAGVLMLAPPSWSAVPFYFAFASLVIASVVRIRRRRWASPEAQASNTWSLMSVAITLLLVVIGMVLVLRQDMAARSDVIRVLAALAASVLLYGHTAMVDPSKRLVAGQATREVLAFTGPAAVVTGLVVWLAPHVPPGGAVLSTAVALMTFALLWRAIRPRIVRALSPDGGRLLRAVDEARKGLRSATDLADLGAVVLAPIRARSADQTPSMLTLAPARAVRVDAAGTAHVDHHRMNDALELHLADAPGVLMVTALMRNRQIRESGLRELVAFLQAEHLLCAVPLSVRDEIEGVLLIPQGSRRASLTLEEMDALRLLGHELGACLSLLGGRDRALARVSELGVSSRRLEEERSTLKDELSRLRGDAKLLRAGRRRARKKANAIAYSEGMQDFLERVKEVAPIPGPMTLVAEAGTPVDRIARDIHEMSGRGEGPFVVADASSLDPRRAAAVLFGTQDQQGWLQLAQGGTLLLADLPGLPIDVQAELAESLAVRRGRLRDSPGSYPLDVRIVASSRVSLSELVERGALAPSLARWLEGLCIRVPSLRERKEDIPSLVLIALDRATRVLGKPAVGISKEALAALIEQPWPGNQRQLQHVIDQAVAHAEGQQVRRTDLPDLKTDGPDPFSGTYAEIEGRVLAHALLAAEGNKSEAARSLDLKRTTFLDKLRRNKTMEPKG